jgi:hypothetical protein
MKFWLTALMAMLKRAIQEDLELQVCRSNIKTVTFSLANKNAVGNLGGSKEDPGIGSLVVE